MAKKVKVKITPEILEQVKKIPPGSPAVQSDSGLVQTGIKIFFIVKIIVIAILNKKIGLTFIRKLYKAIKNLKFNHCFTYWGSGNHVTIDALPQGIRKGNLLKKIMDGSKIKIYHNVNATVQGVMMGKAYSYGTVGRLYGYPDFISFVTDLLRKVFPTLPIPDVKPSELLDHCTENTIVTQDVILTQKMEIKSVLICPAIEERAKTHPQNLGNYFDSEEGKASGWNLVAQFNID